jgi:hypothetical protein
MEEGKRGEWGMEERMMEEWRQRRQDTKEEWKKGNRKRWHGAGGMEEGERKMEEGKRKNGEDGGKIILKSCIKSYICDIL